MIGNANPNARTLPFSATPNVPVMPSAIPRRSCCTTMEEAAKAAAVVTADKASAACTSICTIGYTT